jgi:uncharacterized protein YndB with AHSA1/START domain
MMHPDGRALNTGKVLEIEPHRRLVLSWRHERPAAPTTSANEMMSSLHTRMPVTLSPENFDR